MSYILDALQRAEAERARGGVPTLHVRPLASPLPTTGLTPRQRTGVGLAIILTIGAAILSGWWFAGQPAVQQPAGAAAPSQPVATPATAVLTPLPSPVSVPTRVVAPVTAAPSPTAPTMAAPPAPPAKPAASDAVSEPAPAAPPKAKAVVAADTPAPPAAAAPALVPLLSELPEATRRQIPAMAISGAVYSENPSQRLLLVNGLVLNQGAQVAPDLTVVEIRSNNSEFNFRGTRFRVMH